MAVIFIEGLGEIEIAGDTPTAEEAAAIAGIQPQVTEEIPVTPEPEQIVGEARNLSAFEFFKSRQRERVENLPGLPQFVLEVAPATAGGAAGVIVGTPFGPLGMITGGVIGGLLGEFFAQETGISPESKFALAATAAAPVLGPAGGKVLQLGRRAVAKLAAKAPPAAAALARTTEQEAVKEFSSLGGRILDKQKGLLSQPADRIFAAARSGGVTIPGNQLKNTQRMLSAVDVELQKVASFPEGQQAINLVDQLTASLGTGEVSFDTLISMRQLLGSALGRVERAAGIRLSSSKRLFKGMSMDLENISRAAGRPDVSGKLVKRGQRAKLALAASKRAKLEFAIRDFEQGISRFSKNVPGTDDLSINIAGFQKWLSNITNPKSKAFDKNFTSALGDELPAIKTRLSELAKITQAGSPAGPGSIVIRGRTASAGGAIVGALTGQAFGPVGTAVGAAIGATAPEILTAALMNKTGAALLNRATRLGQGALPTERWVNITQALTQAAQVDTDQ